MDKQPQNNKTWWAVSQSEILQGIDPARGLGSHAVAASRKKHGGNAVDEIKPAGAFALIIESVRQPMMLVLLAIAALSLLFGRVSEAAVMAFVVAAYIAVEFINKYRADKTMTRLRQLTSQTVRVVRGGEQGEIPVQDVVVGDILLLTEGVRIAADARLLEAHGLVVNEAPLTGESLPVEKDAGAVLTDRTPLAERVNSVFSGTTVMGGEGKALVCVVGRGSELGKIAEHVAAHPKEKTILQQSMTKLAKVLAVFAIAVSILIPVVGLLRGQSLQDMVVTWLSLTFLMIPGQPPVIITMALALASFKLAKSNMIVKRLHGVEALAQVTAVVTDKTGTITENKMRAETFVLPDGREVPPGELDAGTKENILLCLPRYGGDPTDKAVFGALATGKEAPLPVSFSGFSEKMPYRMIGYQLDGQSLYFVSGKAETILAESGAGSNNEFLRHALENKSTHGKRVVAYGTKASGEKSEKIKFVAMAVLADPVRKGVDNTIEKLKEAEVQTFVVTGDHPATAQAVAKEIGLPDAVLTGGKLEAMDDAKLAAAMDSTRVFARIAPAQKLRIVKSLQQKGETVAAVGDGVNDAPALVAADVGIAMGETGTDLAKESADLVLADDDYTHLAGSIGVARSAIDNFKKGLTYYLTAKAILLCIFIVPLALGIPFPFAPIHIILTELLMDLASSTIFVTEPAEPDVMKQGTDTLPTFLGAGLVGKMLRYGAPLAIGITGVYLYLYYGTGDVILSQTAAFVTWLLGHILLALNLKQRRLPLFQQGIMSNKYGAGWLVGMVALSLIITMVPGISRYLDTAPLPMEVWALVASVAIAASFWIEAVKCARYKKSV